MKKVLENEKEVEQAKKEISEYKTKYLRALADYQNLEKRINQDKRNLYLFAVQEIVTKFLSVLDILDKAEKHIKDQGLTLAVNSFRDVLRQEGIEKIEVQNKSFNPIEMECVEVVESDKDGQVVEEVRPGYKMGDKILRVAQVKVGKRKMVKKDEELI